MTMITPTSRPEGCRVPYFQLLQWKYAILLEMKGLRYSRGSVSAHAKRVLGIPKSAKKKEVFDHVCQLLGQPEEDGHA